MPLPRWVITPPVVALGMFVACLLLGTAARESLRLLLHSSPVPGRGLLVAVRTGAHNMRLENLTDLPWANCIVTIEGGMRSEPFTFPPNTVKRLGLQSFTTGGAPAVRTDGAGFTRAFHQTDMTCRDTSGQQQSAIFR